VLIVYVDGNTQPLAAALRATRSDVGIRAPYLWAGEVESATEIYAPGRPDIVAAYVARGAREVQIGQMLPDSTQEALHRPEHLAIACPGPHLLATWQAHRSDLQFATVLGVNTAVALVLCDWWLALDGHSTHGVGPVLGDPVRLMPDHQPGAGRWASLGAIAPDVTQGGYTFAAALRLALALRPGTLSIAGWDWEDGPGADGRSAGRDAARWAAEAQEVLPLVDALRAAGVQVHRLRPPGEAGEPQALMPLPALDRVREQQLAALGITARQHLAAALRERPHELLALPRVGARTLQTWAQALGVELP